MGEGGFPFFEGAATPLDLRGRSRATGGALTTSTGPALPSGWRGAAVGAGVGRTRPGSEAAGLRVRPGARRRPPLGAAAPGPFGTRWGPAFALGPPPQFLLSVTLGAFIWLPQRTKMPVVLD